MSGWTGGEVSRHAHSAATLSPGFPLAVRPSDMRSVAMHHIAALASILALTACSSCAAGQYAARETPAAIACLPPAAIAIIAASARHDHEAVVIAVATLVTCWASNQPPPPPLDGGTLGLAPPRRWGLDGARLDLGDPARDLLRDLGAKRCAHRAQPHPAVHLPADFSRRIDAKPVRRCSTESLLRYLAACTPTDEEDHFLPSPSKCSIASLVPQEAPATNAASRACTNILRL